MSIGILTDSTADLRGDLLEKYNIEIIPLSVQFGNKTFKDGVDLSPEEFFNKLKKVDYLPGTSQPSLALFKNKYQEMAEKYDSIISIHPSSSLSGTYSTAKLAAKQLPEIDITTIDSSSVSLGLGFLALLAAKMAKASHSVDKILKATNKKGLINAILRGSTYVIDRPLRKFYSTVWQYQNGPGIDVMKEDWDNLIILDACRYDYFKEKQKNIRGELESVVSRGAHSSEFIEKNFLGRKLHDTIYVTANPYYTNAHPDTL